MTALDVLVCGAGPAGCATALALRRRGVARVGMLDWPLARPWPVGESATPDVGTMLARLGLPQAMDGHASYQGNLSLWGGRRQVDDFLHRGRGMGWHLDRARFDATLRDAVAAAGVTVWRPARIEGLAWEGGGWRARLSDGSEPLASLLVDASGRRAELGTRLGARRHALDRLVALGVVVARPADAGGLAGLSLVEPMPDGWWYAAPLPDGRAVVCLMTDSDVARARGWREGVRFCRAWAATSELSRRLPPPAASPAIGSFAAHSACLDRAAGPGWLAVGDALMSFDPLASSGISGALADGLEAADVLVAALSGERHAAPARDWARRAEASWRRYLEGRARHYGDETRWQDRAFWRSRTVVPDAPGQAVAPARVVA